MSSLIFSRSEALLCAIALLATGCQSWHVHSGPLPEVLEAKAPDQIRVTTADGGRSVLVMPRLAADSVKAGQRTIALADVTRVEVRRVDPFKTFLATIVIVPGVFSLACVMTGCLDFDIGPIFGSPSGGLSRP